MKYFMLVLLCLNAFAQNNTAYYPATGGPSSIAGQAIAPSSVSSKVVNSTGYSLFYPSADMATRVNLCIADVIAGTTTVCDASLETSVNLSTQVTAGNSSAAHGKLIVPCAGSWQANFTNTSGYALRQYGGFDIQGACPLSNNFYIGTTPTSNVYAIYGATGNSFSYIHASGFTVINSGGNATVSGWSSVIDGTNTTDAFADGSYFQNVGVSDGTNGGVKGGVGAILFRNVCCGLTYYSSFLSGSGVGTPVTIQASSSSIVQGLNFVSVTFVGPGGGMPVFSCQDTSTTPTSVVSVFGGYSESDTSNTSSNEAYIDGCRKVTFYGHSFSSNIASNASSLFTTTNRFNTDLEIYGASAIPGVGTWSYPIKGVINGFTGDTEYTDALGNIDYSPPTVPSNRSLSGPATAPSGSCPTGGLWVFSKDGHATFCPSSGGTWTTKI